VEKEMPQGPDSQQCVGYFFSKELSNICAYGTFLHVAQTTHVVTQALSRLLLLLQGNGWRWKMFDEDQSRAQREEINWWRCNVLMLSTLTAEQTRSIMQKELAEPENMFVRLRKDPCVSLLLTFTYQLLEIIWKHQMDYNERTGEFDLQFESRDDLVRLRDIWGAVGNNVALPAYVLMNDFLVLAEFPDKYEDYALPFKTTAKLNCMLFGDNTPIVLLSQEVPLNLTFPKEEKKRKTIQTEMEL
jgi:hypothetical protein